MKQRTLIEVLGWTGVGFILFAYVMVSFDRIDNSSLTYQLLNFFGALGIIIDANAKKDYQPVFLNVVWAVVALIALFSL